MKSIKLIGVLLSIVIGVYLTFLLIFVYNIFSNTYEIKNNIVQMNFFIDKIEKINDEYHSLLESIEKKESITLENEQSGQEIEQLEKEIVDFQNKINNLDY